MLLDLEIFSASMDMTYSVQVVLRVLLADSKNLPFSTSNAAVKHQISVTFLRKKKIIDSYQPIISSPGVRQR